MQQIVLDEPGRFAQRRDAAEPTAGPGEALVRVRRIGVCGTDLHAFAGRQPFFDYPRVLGHELGVEVLEAPADSGLQAGDQCAVEPYLNCGVCGACRRGRTNCCENLRVLGVHIDGGMQPVLALPASKLHRANGLSFDQLALVETLGIGAHAVERGAPAPGEKTLVIGAGPIGLGAIQFALADEADVAVMDLSPDRLAFCREATGVTRSLQPEAGDVVEQVRAVFDGELPTLVIDATGSARSMAGTFDLAGHGGRIVFVGLFRGELSFDDPNFHKREMTLLASRNATPATLRKVIDRIAAGAVDTGPWITHRLTLSDVPERFRAIAEDKTVVKAMIEVED